MKTYDEGLDFYHKLANAIILQAVRDYRSALRRLKKDPDSRAAMEGLMSLEEFFYSDRFRMLTDIDPQYLVGRLRQEVSA